jgi:hypothetical protein
LTPVGLKGTTGAVNDCGSDAAYVWECGLLVPHAVQQDGRVAVGERGRAGLCDEGSRR